MPLAGDQATVSKCGTNIPFISPQNPAMDGQLMLLIGNFDPHAATRRHASGQQGEM